MLFEGLAAMLLPPPEDMADDGLSLAAVVPPHAARPSMPSAARPTVADVRVMVFMGPLLFTVSRRKGVGG
ncbi:hypothetical protein GCM10012320_33520 [Sinomonas cellulolyticus]|nr:hypothetical protein GCM10012320_33520 [Sinomonas sp. KCTC 49339]